LGGQSVDPACWAVRTTHLASRNVVSRRDQKHRPRRQALPQRAMQAGRNVMERAKRQADLTAKRESMIGSGDRSERIRTYNFPQNRLTDHRINLTLYRLDQVMEGDLSEVVAALRLTDREEALKQGGV